MALLATSAALLLLCAIVAVVRSQSFAPAYASVGSCSQCESACQQAHPNCMFHHCTDGGGHAECRCTDCGRSPQNMPDCSGCESRCSNDGCSCSNENLQPGGADCISFHCGGTFSGGKSCSCYHCDTDYVN